MATLSPSSLKSAEFARKLFRATPPAGTTIGDILVPSYWVHVAAKLQEGKFTRIEVVPEDGAWFAEVLVRAASNVHAKVALINSKEFAAPAEAKQEKSDQPFYSEWKGPQRKWSIIRTIDKEYVKDGFDSRDDADDWLKLNQGDL